MEREPGVALDRAGEDEATAVPYGGQPRESIGIGLPESVQYAYPHTMPVKGGGTAYHSGMTLREYYAGQAIEGAACNYNSMDNPKLTAAHAVRLADALIAELEK